MDEQAPGQPAAGSPGSRTRTRGALAEDLAAAYLQLRGATLLARNVRGGGGEIDLVVRDGASMVFVEVRLRGVGAWSTAAGSVGGTKARRLRSCARWLLARRRELTWPGCSYRFDVVALDLQREGLAVSHLRGVRL